MASTATTPLFRKFVTFIFKSPASSTRQLGRWNSVVSEMKVDRNKYVDWANEDHCYCGPMCNVSSVPEKKLTLKNKIIIKSKTSS